MITEVLRCGSSLLLIAVTGAAVYLNLTREEDRPCAEILSYGWGAGVVLLYVIAGSLIRFPRLFHLWHWIYLILVFLLLVSLVWTGNLRRRFRRRRIPFRIHLWYRGSLWATAMLWFLILHVFLIFWININHPIFDVDATDGFRWVGLAKEIYRLGGLPSSVYVWNPAYPSLIPLWPNMFTARWYDSFAAIPWFFFYISILVMSFQFVRRVTASVELSFIYCCILASIPVLWMHVVRPGFSDLIVCYFVTAVCSLLYKSHFYSQRRYFVLSLMYMLGACMSKQEAVAWMILIYLVYGLVYFCLRHPRPVDRLLTIEAAAILALFVLHRMTAEYIHRIISGHFTHLGLLFRAGYDPMAISRLLERTFTWGTFGVYWYLFIGALIYLLVRHRDTFVSLLCSQYLIIFLLLGYYLCFTGNVDNTIRGTNASRLLLQWIPSGSILYVILVSEPLRRKIDFPKEKTGWQSQSGLVKPRAAGLDNS